MWTAHRNSVILNGFVTSPVNQKWNQSTEPQNVKPVCTKRNFLSLKSRSFVDWSCLKPVYIPLKCIKVELLSDYNPAPLDAKCEERLENADVEGHEKESHGVEPIENVEEDITEKPWGLSGDVRMERSPSSWMWEGFSVDDYNPKPALQPLKPKQVKPKEEDVVVVDVVAKGFFPSKVTVPRPFKMTLREESEGHKQRKVRRAWEDPPSEQPPLPPFRANPVPKSTCLPLYDKMVEECERQRRVLHEKRRELMLVMQRPFIFVSKAERRAVTEGDGVRTEAKEGDVPSRSFKDMMERTAQLATRRPPPMRVEKKLTFRPVINRTIPDFGRLHHMFEDRLRRVRQGVQPTVPQPFSFQVNAGGDQPVIAPKETPKDGKKASCPTVKWNLARMRASSQRLTKSALLREEAVRKRLAEREEKRLRAVEQNSDAKSRLQKEVAKWLNAQKQRSATRAQRQQQNCRKEMRVRSAEYQAELADITERVNSRPLLLQRHWQAQARREVEQRFSLILEQAGLDEALLWSKTLLKEQGRQLGVEDTWDTGTDLDEELGGTSEGTKPAMGEALLQTT